MAAPSNKVVFNPVATTVPLPVCTDADGDGFFAEEGCGEVFDCDDGDSFVFPGADEVCDDLVDNDCDGDVDGEDADCQV